MPTHFTVVYDACVLFPAPLRDFLMRLALTDLFRARWSAQIHEEWMRNVLAKRPDLQRAQLERTRDLMNSHVRDCLVQDFEHLIPGIDLPDADDRHVLAAALHCGAQQIISFNLKDFPDAVLQRYQMQAIHPDEFIMELLDLDSAKVLQAASLQRRALKNPALDVETYLQALLRQGLPQSVSYPRRFAYAI